MDNGEAAMHGGEVALARAVIATALADLGLATSLAGMRPARYEDDRLEALEFLTGQSRRWRSSREHWCLLAGIEPDWLARRVSDVLANPPEKPVRPRRVQPAQVNSA